MRFGKMTAAVALAVALVMSGTTWAGADTAPVRTIGTWSGSVEAHGRHFDYVGRACPVETQICIEVVAVYRIVPTTRRAHAAVAAAAGGQATMRGYLVARTDRAHMATLFVHSVE